MHPIAFKLGPLSIHWYGVMVALAFLVSLWTAGRRGLRGGIAAEKIIDLGPWLIVGAIVGARALYVITFWRESFAGQPMAEILQRLKKSFDPQGLVNPGLLPFETGTAKR